MDADGARRQAVEIVNIVIDTMGTMGGGRLNWSGTAVKKRQIAAERVAEHVADAVAQALPCTCPCGNTKATSPHLCQDCADGNFTPGESHWLRRMTELTAIAYTTTEEQAEEIEHLKEKLVIANEAALQMEEEIARLRAFIERVMAGERITPDQERDWETLNGR